MANETEFKSIGNQIFNSLTTQAKKEEFKSFYFETKILAITEIEEGGSPSGEWDAAIHTIKEWEEEHAR